MTFQPTPRDDLSRLLSTISTYVPSPPLERAVTNLKLDSTRSGRVQRARSRFEVTTRNNPILRPLYRSLFLQGSLNLGTAIRPIGENEFDADVVLLLDVRKLPLRSITPRGVLDVIEQQLREVKTFDARIERRDRCFRIDYAGDFHLDILPAHADVTYTSTSAPLLIANRATDNWEETHPQAYARWFKEKNAQSGLRLAKATMLMKRWRDLHDLRQPSSMALTTLLGLAIPQRAPTLAAYIARSLEQLAGMLAPHARRPRLPNPSLGNEDLARDWSQGDYERFVVLLNDAATTAQQALTARSRESKDVWQRLFGDIVT